MIALLFAFLLSFFGAPAMDADPVPACAPVSAWALDDVSLQVALDAGWVGKAGDGKEALYPPGC